MKKLKNIGKLKLTKTTLLDQTKFGYHLLGGIRFSVCSFSSFDVEISQTFFHLSSEDWRKPETGELWG